jgi:ABC-3C biological conflict system middle component
MALMAQLTYEPALDPFHAAYRLLRLRPIIAKHGPLHRDHVRILDFYQLFPFRIEGIRLTPQHRRYRKLALDYASIRPYGEQPDDRPLFSRMEPMQSTGLDTLAVNEFIDPERWSVGEVAATTTPLPTDLDARIKEANERDSKLEEFLDVLASEYELMGINGLKDRSGLMEHRYDAL